MRFDKLDLNLLVTLDALIELKSVSSTAEHLNLTQSAVSGALKRLREYFNDELLARDGRSMVLTGKAQQLAPAIRAILLQVRSTITNPSEFDPATAVRCFTLGCSDYVAMIVGHDLALQVQNEAPGISFKFLPPDISALEMFERGDIDLLIVAESFARPEHPRRVLFEDDARAVCWAGNPTIGDRITLDQFLDMGHVCAEFRGVSHPSVYEKQLAEMGIHRRIEVSVASFAMVPFALVGSRHMGVMHRRHAERFARMLPLKVLPLPLALKPVIEIAQWHRHRTSDPGLEWLLSRLERVLHTMDVHAA
ncbi:MULTISPECIES: LysR family transcriptional regulator [unclassified Novosphingobium]|uniref:LysR family transcriptional regulator n=1 Tax=unclassified Novosphingobium TaxID=2644732 RepID=UPI000D309022|nr:MULTISPECIES: LysR family transcriptional regulator [unclassified Novosphingobium]PTR07665.1 DNA-binding transcriptional LysR family regulator [Novosphingobium sp. GV055]PUB00351.1 DNA-binding transcriptional LysR family regulator [Novosphingobium sp. GV061]PUB15690.1 DNA-binding transcriptional LysR family regulator [Novosphingobium sp. GV079]PUB39377.1 DNA-binding transcriptional LysR family regulator [Novosphingobium sp. GV027]